MTSHSQEPAEGTETCFPRVAEWAADRLLTAKNPQRVLKLTIQFGIRTRTQLLTAKNPQRVLKLRIEARSLKTGKLLTAKNPQRVLKHWSYRRRRRRSTSLTAKNPQRVLKHAHAVVPYGGSVTSHSQEPAEGTETFDSEFDVRKREVLSQPRTRRGY